MNDHRPNQEMLTAYLDGLLSPDGMRSMKQHLRSCAECAAALETERAMLGALDDMRRQLPPVDFVEGVMGRVAQYPTHRPAAPVDWVQMARWATAASVLLGAIGLGVLAWMFGSGLLEGSRLVATVVSESAGLLAAAVAGAREAAAWVGVLLEATGEMVWRLATLAVNAGWLVQITLLLLTVSLNYAFTRLVVNYQRRP